MINENFVYLGALLNLIGSLNYVWNTLKGRTQPNRVTWTLWALAPLIAFTAMIGQGVGFHAALLTFMVGFGPLMVLIASFMNKKSTWQLTRFDIVCGVLSVLGLIGWWVTQTGDIAIFFSIVADGLAGLPTIIKAWKDPDSESPLVFLNGAISGIITLLTLTVFDFRHIGFTIYITILCIIIFVLVQFKVGPRVSGFVKKLGKEEQRKTV